MRVLIALIAAAWFFGISDARAQTPDTSEWCREMGDCRGQEYAVALAGYDLEPIREVAAQGREVVRVLFRDDYSRPMPGVVVERTPTGAVLTVITPIYGKPPLESVQVWAHVQRRVVYRATLGKRDAEWVFQQLGIVFDAPPEPADTVQQEHDGVVTICMHPRGGIVEAASNGRSIVRRTLSCPYEALWGFAWRVGELALKRTPPCDGLKRDDPPYYVLKRCALMQGDFRATVSWLNYAFAEAPDEGGVEVWRPWLGLVLAKDATVAWNGQPPVTGKAAAIEALLARLGLDKATYYGSPPEGLGPRRVREIGELFFEKRDDAPERTAPLEVVWRREIDGRWLIERWVVGPVRPVPTEPE